MNCPVCKHKMEDRDGVYFCPYCKKIVDNEFVIEVSVNGDIDYGTK